MLKKLLTEIDPQTISLRNMGYRVNQGNTWLKNKPETIHSGMINVNPTRILWDLTSYFLLIPSALLLIPYSKDRNKKHQKYMFMENNACNAHNKRDMRSFPWTYSSDVSCFYIWNMEEGIRKKEEGRRKEEEGRRKKE